MTPKEKAEELYKKMYTVHSNIYPSSAKQCALIAVDELINEAVYEKQYNYWQEVKNEINNL